MTFLACTAVTQPVGLAREEEARAIADAKTVENFIVVVLKRVSIN